MDKLKTFIENARAKGYDDGRIKAALLKAGWPSERIESALAASVQRPSAVSPLQPADQADDNVNLDNLNIDSDKPVQPAGAKPATVPKKPFLKRWLPIAGLGLVILIGLIIAGNGFNSFKRARVPGGFVITKGQIAFSIPGKKGQYDTRVNFKTPDGNTHSFVTPTPPASNNNSKYVAGDGMSVAYYPQNPDMTAMNLTDRGSPIVGIAIMIAGAVITIVGAFFLQRQLRRR